MSELVEVLEQLAVSTAPAANRCAEIERLAEASQLSAELTDALRSADLSGVIQLAGMPGRGCYLIVAPDEPEQPDDDDTEEPPVTIQQH